MEIVKMYMNEIVLYVFFSLFVFATLETIKGLIKSINYNWKLKASVLRWLNFGVAFLYAWAFNFQLGNMIFKQAGNDLSLNKWINYLVVACLIYVGSKRIWQWISTQKAYFNNEKRILSTDK